MTGGNRGIGFEVCRQLAEAGMQVYVGSRELSEGEHAARELQNQGLRVKAVQLDMSSTRFGRVGTAAPSYEPKG